MRNLAIIKIGLRTQLVFPGTKPPHTTVQPRHWLSYPITTHTARAWARGARLPNSLRFKVRRDADNPTKLHRHVKRADWWAAVLILAMTR
jgi:CRISPR-associated protein Cmr1